MARIFDCFPFHDELDLLDIHLRELSDCVDRFVIAEATTSFSGEPKKLNFPANRDRFAPFLDRIDYIVVDDFPPGMKPGWARQWHQREALARGLADAEPDDLILLCDVDEIVRASALRSFAARETRRAEIGCFSLRHFNYFLNWECAVPWLRSSPRAVRREYLRSFKALRGVRGPSERWPRDLARGFDTWRRMGRPMRRVLVADAGWHFSYLGGPATVMRKARDFLGSELSSLPYASLAEIARQIADGRAVMPDGQRALSLRAIDASFPQYVRDHRAAFEALIADEETPDRLRRMLATGAFDPG